MKENELRIGNNIFYLGKNTVVNSVAPGYVSSFNSGIMPINAFRPIPLTEELLLKIGFKEVSFKQDMNRVFYKEYEIEDSASGYTLLEKIK